VFPSLAEGFGLPVLEALAGGAIVVTSTRVPLPGLEDVALLCDPHDSHSIARALQRALHEPLCAPVWRSAGASMRGPLPGAVSRPRCWRFIATP
jgi:glycosyltransferase involved in cell wall biosynthesis